MNRSVAHAGAVSATIPVVDLADYFAGHFDGRTRAAAELRYALENIGFFCIVNHGVDADFIADVYTQTRRFHALPESRKRALSINADHVGYMPNEGELPRTSPYAREDLLPDVGEAFFVKRDQAAEPLPFANQWPDVLPGFREMIVSYYDRMETLAKSLLPLYACALDLTPDYFANAFDAADNLSVLRLAHFPPHPLPSNQFNVGPHTDSSFLTLLPATDVPGLELLTRDGNWFLARPPAGSIIVNSGDLLTRWTNDRFLSTPHRVRSVSGRDRYSIPFFFQPNPEQVIACLPGCGDPDGQAEPPITAADYFAWFMRENFAHASRD